MPRKVAMPAPRGRGRAKWGAAVRRVILRALRDGAKHYHAAELAGVDERTLKRWLAAGRANIEAVDLHDAGEGPEAELDDFGEFYLAVAEVRGRADQPAVRCIVRAIERGDVKAAQWWLERRRPAEYGQLVRSGRATVDELGDLHDDEQSDGEAILEALAVVVARTQTSARVDEVAGAHVDEVAGGAHVDEVAGGDGTR